MLKEKDIGPVIYSFGMGFQTQTIMDTNNLEQRLNSELLRKKGEIILDKNGILFDIITKVFAGIQDKEIFESSIKINRYADTNLRGTQNISKTSNQICAFVDIKLPQKLDPNDLESFYLKVAPIERHYQEQNQKLILLLHNPREVQAS